MYVPLQHWLCKSLEQIQLEITDKVACCGYCSIGRAIGKIQKVMEDGQLKQTRAFICPFSCPFLMPNKTQASLDQLRSIRVGFPIVRALVLTKQGHWEIWRVLVKYTHARSHTQTALFGAAGGTRSNNEWHTWKGGSSRENKLRRWSRC